MGMHQILNYYPRIFLIALAGSFLGTFLVRRLAIRYRLVDIPNSRKIHLSPVALGGGVALYFAFAFAVYTTRYYDRPLQGIAIGGLLTLVIGLVDDWKKGIPATFKFFYLSRSDPVFNPASLLA